MEIIMQEAIADIRLTLQTDRVLIYQFLPQGDGLIAYEAAAPEWTPIVGQLIADPCLQEHWIDRYRQGQVTSIADIHAAPLAECYVQLMNCCQVNANLVAPILCQGDLWGLLIVHHCRSSRDWQPLEVQYLRQIALHLGLVVWQDRLGRSQPSLPQARQPDALLAQYERIISATPDCVSLVDRNYIYQLVNQTYLRWNQKAYHDIVGHSVSDLLGAEFFETIVKPRLDRCLAGEPLQSFEIWQDYSDGQRRYIRATYAPYIEGNGEIGGVVINVHDLTELKQAEEAVREREVQVQLQSAALEACADIVMITDQRGIIEWVNPAFTEIAGYSPEEAIGKNPSQLVKSGYQDRSFYQTLWTTILSGHTWRGEIQNRRKDGRLYIESATITPVRDRQQRISHFIAIKQDITERKRLEQMEHQRFEQERMMNQISQYIRQSLDLDQILTTAVTQVRHFLQTDRVIIYRLHPDWSGVVLAEAVAPEWQAILGMEFTDTYFVETQGGTYHDNHINVVPDIYTRGFSTCHIEMLERFQVRAKLVVPILYTQRTWGLLIAHQCSSPRQWQPTECELMMRLATQMAIAIQQSELHQQVQRLNANLEVQVQERTIQLQQSLHFEGLLKRITDKVRDSLDEQQILQTVVEELAYGLAIEACDTGIYTAKQTISTIVYEVTNTLSPAQGRTFALRDAPHAEIYPYLLQGQVCQFCDRVPNYLRTSQRLLTILACPIRSEKEVLGDLWLFKPLEEHFNELEVRLVQQVANQCAIALRQSRLYQAAQTQLKELERLSQLKDDFLSTVSHELRTPMSSIKMATQMLEISLTRMGLLADESSPVKRYFNILRTEGQREISLINDLLDLARLDAGMESLRFTQIDLQFYLSHWAEPFIERIHQQHQHFILHVPPHLPPLITDLSSLERILTELLNNACKYTHQGETITLSAQSTLHTLKICVSNSGVEIPETEHKRLFDKFYRIPNNDPWKYGGTGLGLALVQKLAERLGATIHVESGGGQTTFVLEFRAD